MLVRVGVVCYMRRRFAYSEARGRGRGGIGRRAALRSLWGNSRGSSSLLDRTNPFIEIRIGVLNAVQPDLIRLALYIFICRTIYLKNRFQFFNIRP